MGKLKDKWNKNNFSVYTSEEKTTLKLIEDINKFVGDELVKEVEQKTDLTGNHLGAWQGLNKPTLSEEGMRAVVEKINDIDLPSINSQLGDIVPINIDKYTSKIIPSTNSYNVDVDSLNAEINLKETPVLNLSQRNYVLSKPLILKSRTSLFSYGAIPFFDTENKESVSNTVISSSVSMDSLIIGENVEGVYINGITIDGTKRVINGIKLTNSKCITIENSLITHCVNGIVGNVGQLYQLDKVTIKYNSGYGMKLNKINDSNMDMVYFTSNIDALEMTDCGTWSIHATKFEWNRGYGIRHIYTTNSDSIKISNCTFHQNNKSGIRADRMDNWSIVNNYFNGNGNNNANIEGENTHIYNSGVCYANIIGNSFAIGVQDEGQNGATAIIPHIGIQFKGITTLQLLGNKILNSGSIKNLEFTGATLKNCLIQSDDNLLKMYDNNGNVIFDTTIKYSKPNKITSTTRPTLTGADSGMLFYETDTDNYIKWNGFAWRGLGVNIGGTLPTPSADYRGKEYVVFGTGSNPDKKYICLFTGGSYKWFEVNLTVVQ